VNNNVLTLQEAALFLKVRPETVVALLESQEIAGRLLDGDWRTTQRAVLYFVDGGVGTTNCCVPMDASGKPCCSGEPGCC
jgi:hypothetical protein